jgi:FkbM family methyltransferase
MSHSYTNNSNTETVGASPRRGLLKQGISFVYRRLNSRQRLMVGKLPGLVPLYRAVTRRWLTSGGAEDGLALIRLHRFVFYLEAEESGEGLLFDSYEPATTFVFERLVAPGDLVVDVGAHWGYFTLLAATLCGDTGRVVAFEPHPRNLTILNKNLQANHLQNVDVVPKAVSDGEGLAKLFLSRASSGNSLISLPPGAELSVGEDGCLAVETVTLDGFFAPPCRKPALVKIDIEGAELVALDGMRTLIRETADLALITEFNPFYFPGDRGEAFLRRLTEQGFELAIIDDARFEIEAGTVQQLSQRALNKGYKVNVLAACERRMDQALSPEAVPGAPRRRAPKIVRL